MRFGLAFLAFAMIAGPCVAEEMTIGHAEFGGPTQRYKHGALGDDTEYTQLTLTLGLDESGPLLKGLVARSRIITFSLPKHRVFEDTAPRLVDVDGDGRPEVIVVETDVAKGASLAIYDASGKVAATPFIGAAHRWLAPAGVGDFNDDGSLEIAYIDRPHLQRDLVFLQYAQGELTEVGRIPGLTNHRFGDPRISGGVRNCGQGDELILANRDWTEVMSARLDSTAPRSLGPFRTDGDITRALKCLRPPKPVPLDSL